MSGWQRRMHVLVEFACKGNDLCMLHCETHLRCRPNYIRLISTINKSNEYRADMHDCLKLTRAGTERHYAECNISYEMLFIVVLGPILLTKNPSHHAKVAPLYLICTLAESIKLDRKVRVQLCIACLLGSQRVLDLLS